MKEYFILSILYLFIIALLDISLKTKLYQKKLFWNFQLIVFLLTAFVDHFSAARPIVLYNENIILGPRVFQVPIENFLFGFNMLYLNLIIFEKFNQKV
ncbi:MAG: lycopene cyclase domain-containing protein [Patescibacteria group bacterium]